MPDEQLRLPIENAQTGPEVDPNPQPLTPEEIALAAIRTAQEMLRDIDARQGNGDVVGPRKKSNPNRLSIDYDDSRNGRSGI